MKIDPVEPGHMTNILHESYADFWNFTEGLYPPYWKFMVRAKARLLRRYPVSQTFSNVELKDVAVNLEWKAQREDQSGFCEKAQALGAIANQLHVYLEQRQ